MVRAGKAAKKANQIKAGQQEQIRKAQDGPLYLRDVVPPDVCVRKEFLDDEMEPIKVLTGEEDRNWRTDGKSGIAADPYLFGEKNLRYFQDYWRKKLSETERHIVELGRDKPEGFDQKLLEAKISRARLQAVIRYLDSLIALSRIGRAMPALPQCRKLGHFKPKRRVMVFIPKNSDLISYYHDNFMAGTVSGISVDGTTVTVRLDRDIRYSTHSISDPCYLTFPVGSMRVMRKEEYEVLLQDSYLRGWVGLSAAYEEDPHLGEDMKNRFELDQIDQRVGDYKHIAKIRSERK